ncbi:MAG: FISUMP domain-containing protein [bacterium]
MNYRISAIVIIALVAILTSCDNKSTGPTVLTITSITPNSGYVCDTVTILGTNFGDIQERSYITFPSTKATKIISWSDKKILLEVPVGTKSGKVTVSVNGDISNELDFTVKTGVQVTTVTDIDGNVYKTVKIGNHWWMAENLNVSHYRNGDLIPQVKDSTEWINLKTGAWCYYNNDPAMGAIYGKLYNWYAVNDPRGLAPLGSHIASDSEWTEMVDSFGGYEIAGDKLKSTGSIENGDGLWLDYNVYATNESGFSALPNGYRDDYGFFEVIGYNAFWWTSTVNLPANAWLRYLSFASTYVNRYYYDKGFGLAVRCLRD